MKEYIVLALILFILCFRTGIWSRYQVEYKRKQIHIWDSVICMNLDWKIFTGEVNAVVGDKIVFWKRAAKKEECDKVAN